jgi:hypothetical protein
MIITLLNLQMPTAPVSSMSRRESVEMPLNETASGAISTRTLTGGE